jgi:hypothetical protein
MRAGITLNTIQYSLPLLSGRVCIFANIYFMKSIYTYLFLLHFFCCVFVADVNAQSPQKTFGASMPLRQDSMKQYAFDIVNAASAAERFNADSVFTKMLVRALKEPYSFYFPFDSLQTISRLYAPDSSFRIFTWQVVKD